MNATSSRGLTSADAKPRRMRVVHIVSTLHVGGLERVVLDLVRRRTAEAADASVICLDSSGKVESGFREVGVPVEVIGTEQSVPRRVLTLARRLRVLRPDVVHTHNAQAHLHGALASQLARVPIVIHTKHGQGHQPGIVLRWMGRLASLWTARYIAVSEDAARIAIEVERVAAGKVLVIHNGVDTELYRPHTDRRETATVVAITVGRLDPVKDQKTLLHAVKQVIERVPSFCLDVVGDGPSRAELDALVETLRLRDHVRLLGYSPDVAQHLSRAAFFVLSSLSEGVPLAALEAMACGLPVAATDVGGMREVVVPGETGLLVPAGSADALAEALVTLACDPTARDRMGRAARLRVETRFSARTVVAKYEAVYRECLTREVN